MGKVVYNNAASFLRVCDQGLEDKAVDFFDDTRIHPECYIQNDFAPKVIIFCFVFIFEIDMRDCYGYASLGKLSKNCGDSCDVTEKLSKRVRTGLEKTQFKIFKCVVSVGSLIISAHP